MFTLFFDVEFTRAPGQQVRGQAARIVAKHVIRE